MGGTELRQCARARAWAMVAAILFMVEAVLAVLAVPGSAQAATLAVDDDFSEVSAQGIVIYDLGDYTPAYTTTNSSSFKLVTDATLWNKSSTTGVYSTDCPYAVMVKKPTTTSTSSNTVTTEISGTATLKFTGCGVDADGDAIDVTVTVGDVVLQVTRSSAAYSGYVSLVAYKTGASVSSEDASELVAGIYLKDSEANAAYGAASASFSVSVSITKTGTSTAASGDYIFFAKDIDTVGTSTSLTNGYDYQAESMRLDSGFGGTVWVTSGCTLSISNNNTLFTATEKDDETMDSGFVTTAGASFSFTWAGPSCGTAILDSFEPSTITSSTGTGGSISPSGATTVYWKNSQTYTITAATGYKVAALTVDGSAIGSYSGKTGSFTYTFSSVTADHTIAVTWAPITYTVSFNANGGSGSMAAQTLTYNTASSLSANAFARTGYTFSGWATSAAGSVVYADGQSVKNLSSSQGATVALYAVWEPIICVEVPTLVACVVMPDGEVVAPTGYEIENKSVVEVVTTADGLSASGVAADTVTHLVCAEDGVEVFNTQDGMLAAFSIDAGSSIELVWEVEALDGSLNEDLLAAATAAAAEVCTVDFVFEVSE